MLDQPIVLSLTGYKTTVVGAGGAVVGTVAVVLPALPATLAVSTAEPAATPVASPAALTLTLPGALDAHDKPASAVMSFVKPSE